MCIILDFQAIKEASLRDGTYWHRMQNGREIMLRKVKPVTKPNSKWTSYETQQEIKEKRRAESNRDVKRDYKI